MVTRDDLARANGLNSAAAEIQRALALNNPMIVQFVLRGEPVPDSMIADAPIATVSAEGIETPPQMMAAIKAQVEKRLAAIGDELKALGVIGG